MIGLNYDEMELLLEIRGYRNSALRSSRGRVQEKAPETAGTMRPAYCPA